MMKADSSQTPIQILVDGVTSPVAADVQVVELATVTGGVASAVAAGNPLPTAAQVSSVPAAADTTDAVAAALQVNKLKSGLTDLVPGRAFANVGASTANSVLKTPTASKTLIVLAVVITPGGTPSTVTFNSWDGSTGTAMSPVLSPGGNVPLVLPFNPAGWFASASGSGLAVTTGAGSTTGIAVVYALV